ncbi:hypothetical protein [Mesonia sp.]|uniref:hypothetical protein n=1 Tax=Mesonia sp. TaxID=1960830 RepID=UPI003F9D8D4D
MKKLLAVAVLNFSFIFTALGLNAQPELIYKKKNCANEAISAYDHIYSLTYDSQLTYSAADTAYDDCISAGGSPGGLID